MPDREDRSNDAAGWLAALVVISAGLAIWAWRMSEWAGGNFWTW